jgi:hypothetical protein
MSHPNLPMPRYKHGDIVWTYHINSTKALHECPDCLGTKKWEATSPAGEKHTVSCPRCESMSYLDRSIPPLTYTKSVVEVRRLTVGSIQVDTKERNGGPQISYMAHETGIGSGSIWAEDRLFATAEAAEVAGQGAAMDLPGFHRDAFQ